MFYENFEELCKANGTSPFAVTTEIGYSNAASAGWKRNGTIPKQEVLEKLAAELNCNVSDFFKTDEERKEAIDARARLDKAIPKDSIEIDDNIQDFIDIYKACTNRQRNQLMNAVYDFEQKVLNP